MAVQKLTAAQRRNLDAVHAGFVYRHYDHKGNFIRGAHSATIKDLEGLKLVREERAGQRGLTHHYRIELTPAGEKARKEWAND